MAAALIVAGFAIAEKVEKKKEAKRQKKLRDEARYRELQIETNRRLAGRSGQNVLENAGIQNAEGEVEEEEEEDQNFQSVANDAPPPPYEDAVQVGERREREWQAQMQRRRSSVNSGQSSRSQTNYTRMG